MSEKAVAKDLEKRPSPGPSSAVLFLLKEVTVEPQCDNHLEVVQEHMVPHGGSPDQDVVVRDHSQLIRVTEDPERLSRY